MFSFFKKSTPIITAENRVWLNQKSRYAGLYQHISEVQHSQLVVVVTFFENTFEQTETLLKSIEKPFRKIELSNDLQANENIWLITSENFLLYAQELQKQLAKRNFIVIFPEHYPVHTEEDKILKIISEITFKTKVYFYADLDEKLFEIFVGLRIKELVVKLGLKEEDVISHNVVSKSLRNAQQKIAETIKTNYKARSQQEWFEKNK